MMQSFQTVITDNHQIDFRMNPFKVMLLQSVVVEAGNVKLAPRTLGSEAVFLVGTERRQR